jgi:hypothetical protein
MGLLGIARAEEGIPILERFHFWLVA